MKKIGILTTSYANNYGALLQSYALTTYLNSLDNVSAELINYMPSDGERPWHLFPRPRNKREFLATCFAMLNPAYYRRTISRNKKNKAFCDSLKKSRAVFYPNSDFSLLENEYDVVAVGSDQVWNTKQFLPSDIMPFFLNFKSDRTVKVSYAASVADPFTDEMIPIISPLLSDFDYISVREYQDLDPVNSLSGKSVEWVCDPVFLLGKKKWDEVLHTNQVSVAKQIVPNHYILVYMLYIDNRAIDFTKKLSKKFNLPIVCICLSVRDKIKSDFVLKNVGPLEFVNYIKNASFVVTNSFHCTAFSIIYRKDYFVIPKKVANNRMISLQKAFGIQNRFVNCPFDEWVDNNGIPVDYSNADIQEDLFVKKSVDYIRKWVK